MNQIRINKYGMIILAAGKGTRMKSDLPKGLNHVAGKPILGHLIDLAPDFAVQQPIIICGYKSEKLKQVFSEKNILWVEQKQQLGTAHAVSQSLQYLNDNTIYFILVGDAPLIQSETLSNLANAVEETGISVLSVIVEKPFGYGRIIRDTNNKVQYIVEEKDATDQEKNTKEVNSGFFAIKGKLLKDLLPKIENNNQQNEYYLTDIVKIANENGYNVSSFTSDNANEVAGCNDKKQLAALERYYQIQQAENLMLAGATLVDPNRIDIRGSVSIGKDICIDINCIFEGNVSIGDNVKIDANCIIKDTTIENNAHIKANSMVDSSHIGSNVSIGPFARIRPNTKLGSNSKIGNFVETKNSSIGENTKVSHLSYIGDSLLAQNINIGAGTITCNYDGINKHQTIIEDDVFIGSNTALVAPITIKKGATVAAGSTITQNVGENSLAISRIKAKIINHWIRPNKIK